MLSGFACLIYVFVQYQTVFFLSLNFREPTSLFNPEASKWYSLALITMLGCAIASYIFRFFTQPEWSNLVRNAVYLLIMGLIINNPIKDAFVDFPYFDLKSLGTAVIVLLTVIFAIGFIKSLIIVWIRTMTK